MTSDPLLHRSDLAEKFTLAEVKAAVDAMVREDDYSPEDAQRRVAELLRRGV